MVENIKFSIKVFDNYIEMIPEGGVKDNSIYEIKLKDLKQLNGSRELTEKVVKIATAFSPAYCTIDAVNSLIESLAIPDEIILYHIREASGFVDYLAEDERVDVKNIPYAVVQYVKYKASYECALRFSVERSAEGGLKGVLGDIQFQADANLPDITELLRNLKGEVGYWYDNMRGYKAEGRAKPKTAIKSSFVVGTRPRNDIPPNRTFTLGAYRNGGGYSGSGYR